MQWLVVLIVVVVILGLLGAYLLARRTLQTGPRTVNRGRLPRGNRDLTTQVRQWVANKSGDGEISAWVASLSEAEQKALVSDLLLFSLHSKFNLVWLVEDEFARDQRLQADLTAAVVQYLRARRIVAQADASIRAFETFRRVVTRPGSNEAYIQRLYTDLVQNGLAPATAPDMVMASGSKRRVYLLEMINNAADSNWPRFSEVLMATNAAIETERQNRRFRLPRLTRRNQQQQQQPEAAPAETMPEPPATDQGDGAPAASPA
ncbi:MAG: hypothetical protein GYB67_10805 [Chloroflexi bacterium]|nr:hypothetical protein [Chloroflexota bacterium]